MDNTEQRVHVGHGLSDMAALCGSGLSCRVLVRAQLGMPEREVSTDE